MEDLLGTYSTKALMVALAELHHAIFRTECFNAKDLSRFRMIESELKDRGVEVDEELVFKQKEDNDA